MAPKARLVVLTVLAAAAAGLAATCGPEPTGSEPDQLDATLTVSAQVGDRVAAVSVEVSAPDIRTPIVANIPVTDGVASGTVTVPAGSDRLTTVHAFDDNAIETHRGAKTVNLKEGDNQVVEIALDPLTGQEPIVATVATYTVTLEPADTAIDVLETAQLSATVTDAAGQVVQNPALDWGSTNPVVAGVDGNGLVTGGHAGVTSIVVTYLGVVATTRVVVAGEAVEKIAFESDRDGGTRVYVMNTDGSDLTRLGSGDGFSEYNPAWSPDGSRIAVWHQPEGSDGWDIYLLAPDGSGATNLTNNPAHYRFQAWSPDGTRLAFIIDTGTTDVYTINADGSGLVNLTNDPTALSRYPAWSPDGTRIAFDALYDDGTTVRRVINVMNADGSGRVRVANHDGDDYQPVWSPDGSRIAFENQDTRRTIYTVNADGSGLTRLSPADTSATKPAWSPDGTRVAFNNYGNTLYANVAVINADGTGLINLTNIPGVSQSTPQWSPDGSRILYVSYQDGNGEVYVMSADGTGQTNLTNDPGTDVDARWARTLVFPAAGS